MLGQRHIDICPEIEPSVKSRGIVVQSRVIPEKSILIIESAAEIILYGIGAAAHIDIGAVR